MRARRAMDAAAEAGAGTDGGRGDDFDSEGIVTLLPVKGWIELDECVRRCKDAGVSIVHLVADKPQTPE
ncbi:hypothetical protein EJB05_39878, partial [Eragrostis curvula]